MGPGQRESWSLASGPSRGSGQDWTHPISPSSEQVLDPAWVKGVRSGPKERRALRGPCTGPGSRTSPRPLPQHRWPALSSRKPPKPFSCLQTEPHKSLRSTLYGASPKRVPNAPQTPSQPHYTLDSDPRLWALSHPHPNLILSLVTHCDQFLGLPEHWPRVPDTRVQVSAEPPWYQRPSWKKAGTWGQEQTSPLPLHPREKDSHPGVAGWSQCSLTGFRAGQGLREPRRWEEGSILCVQGQDQEEAAESAKEQGTARNGDNLNKSPGTGMRVAQM